MSFDQLMSAIGDNPSVRQVAILVGAVVLALLVRLLFTSVIAAFTRKTRTDIDNRIARELRGPLFWTIMLVGVIIAYHEFQAPDQIDYFVLGIIETMLLVLGVAWPAADGGQR